MGEETTGTVVKANTWVPSSAVSFADYDSHCAAIEQMEQVYDLTNVLQQLISNALWSPDVADKAGAINGLVSEYQKRIAHPDHETMDKEVAPLPTPRPTSVEKPTEQNQTSNMLFVKEQSGRLRWFAIYSNNFRDDDGKPEIISEKSHKAFTQLCRDGLVPLPELWHWHVPGTKWGQADYVDYHDGMAYASGLVDEGHEKEAEVLQTMDVRVSHGMPKWSIVRNSTDPSVIDFHLTKEISPLPAAKAANKFTGFVIKESDMKLSQEKVDHLKTLGYGEADLQKIDNVLAAQKAAAEAEGRESKEAEAAPEGNAATEVTPVVEPIAQPPALTAAEIAEAVSAVVSPLVAEISQLKVELSDSRKEISDLKAKEAQRDAQIISATPALSLKELMAQSIFGKPEAQIDGRSALAKDKPVEKEFTPPSVTGIPFIDALVAANKPQAQAQ